MLESDKKREENIIEYALYMFHTEDVIRSCQLNLDLIKSAIIDPSGLEKEIKNELLDWYTDLVSKMEKDNIEDRGHLSEVIDIIGLLYDCVASNNPTLISPSITKLSIVGDLLIISFGLSKILGSTNKP